MAQNPFGSLTTQKASAALGATIGVALADQLFLTRFPAAATAGGSIVIGLGLAWIGGAMLDGHAEAFVLGTGVGLAVRGLLGFVNPSLRVTA